LTAAPVAAQAPAPAQVVLPTDRTVLPLPEPQYPHSTVFDVRNAISTILDRYSLADIVEITLRKYRRDKVTPPFLNRAISLTSILSKQTKSPVERKSKPKALKQLSGSRGSQLQNGHAKRAAR
jgi:hypothetical protein